MVFTSVQAYEGIPFSYRLIKAHYYDIAGTLKGGEILLNATFRSYQGLNMSYYQGTDSLMTVTVDGGTLPNHGYSQGAFGCLATANEGPGVYTNYTKIGSPYINIETGVVSGFSGSDYLKLPTAFSPGSSTWECILKVKTGSDVSTNQKLFHSCLGSAEAGRFGIGVNLVNGHFGFFCSSDGSSWLFDLSGTHSVQTNTTYWVKFGWDGSGYYLAYSTDGSTYTTDITYTSSSPIYSPLVNTYLGVYSYTTMYQNWLGSFDLSGCSIKIEGNIWWSPLDAGLYLIYKEGYTNYTKIGNPSVNEVTGVASSFSSSDYITLGTFSPQGNTWEYYIKFTTGSSTSAQGLSTCVGSSDGCSPFYIDGGNLIAFLSSNGSSWNIASSETIMSISTNTTYKMKAEFTGTEYNWYLWENNSWTLKKTITSSSAIYDGLTMLLGNNRGQNNPFGGTIDLSETYITIGGNTWWTPKGSYVNYTKVGSPIINTNTGIATGFTASNYLVMPQEFPSSGTYKMIFNTTFKNSVTGVEQSFFARNDNVNITIYFEYGSNNIAYWNGTDYEVGSTTFVDNTKYWIGAEFDSSTLSLKIYSMVDNGTYTLSTLPSFSSWTSEISTTLGSDDFSNKTFRFCTNANTNHYYAGNLDLSGCQISVNNSVYWTPVGGIPITVDGLLPSGVIDDGSAQTWNLFYNKGDYKLNTASTMSGYSWCGEIAIPAHTV